MAGEEKERGEAGCVCMCGGEEGGEDANSSIVCLCLTSDNVK